jgi:DtxR family transcriptional regulator, manganese transport regulator
LGVATQTKKDISRTEDYLEAIYNLNETKGYISTADISETLNVKPATVSSMVTKLAKEGYLVHERYRGMKLTEQGEKVARSVRRRHDTIAEFLEMLGIEEGIAYEDTEGIEHHLHPVTAKKFVKLVEFLRRHQEILDEIVKGIEM